MSIRSLSLRNFRNTENETLFFREGLNLLQGENASGKTTVIEAVFCFAHSRSFRHAKDRDMIRFGENEAKLSAVFADDGEESPFSLTLSTKERKQFIYNGRKIERMKDLFGNVLAVLFVPEYLRIVKNGPGERRSFLDGTICQIVPSYIVSLYRYQCFSEEKNALLKQQKLPDASLLDTYDACMVKEAAIISEKRRHTVEQIAQSAAVHFEKLSGGDKLTLHFLPGGSDAQTEDLQKWYEAAFFAARENDLRFCRSTAGCQYDDFEICINGKPARLYASQGQQRSAVVALKLAEGDLMEEKKQKKPIFLFDDILSELDDRHRAYLFTQMNGRQVLMTTCETVSAEMKKAAHIITAEKGHYR